MDFAAYPSLRNRPVYVTGGGSGIGGAIVRSFARQGAKVAFTDRDEATSEKLVEKIRAEAGVDVHYARLEVTDLDALQNSVSDMARLMGGLNVLVNNVGNDERHDPLEVTPARWRDLMAVNLDAAFFATQAAMPFLEKSERGAVVNLSSINALLGPAEMPAYVAAKSALLGLTKSMARDFGPKNVRANAVLPGWVATERQLETWLTEEAEEKWSKLVALQGRIQAEDIAAMVMFLSADDSSMITGQHFVVDAGRT